LPSLPASKSAFDILWGIHPENKNVTAV